MPALPDDPGTIGLIVERRHLGSGALAEFADTLDAAGWRLDVVVPDDETVYGIAADPPPWDLALSRGRDLAGLGILATAAAAGIPALNAPAAIDLVRNKVAMHATLLRHGVPVPATWFAHHPALFERLDESVFPLVVKPYDGDGSAGLSLLERPSDARLVPAPADGRRLFVAQTLLETGGFDLKLYGIGREIWAVRKPSPVSFQGPGPARPAPPGASQLVELDDALREIAITCGQAFGLELFGVDVAATPDGPMVIEVNDFPTYSAVPNAAEALGAHVLRTARLHRFYRSVGRDRLRSLVRGAD
jgi:ribosomal protein S6--L-glutamate ligase